MRTYEVLFILSPQVGEDDAKALVDDFRGIAEKSGARLTTEEPWGRKRLASPIEKFNEGIYHLFVFEADNGVLSELDRRMKNSDRVLRHMITRTDEDLKRAAKLAKRNPKKERQPRPMGGSAPSVSPSAPAAPAEPAAAPAPEAPPPAAAPTEAAPTE